MQMKFTYEKFPILMALKNGTLENIKRFLDDPDDHYFLLDFPIELAVDDSFQKNAAAFRSSIMYISVPLSDAIKMAVPKMPIEWGQEPTKASGTIILPRDDKGISSVYCYNFSATHIDDRNKTFKGCVFSFRGDVLMRAICSLGDDLIFHSCETLNPQQSKEKCLGSYNFINTVLTFLAHAETQIKLAESNKPVFEGQSCIYNNRSKFPITIIDSTWLTTLVKSDAFKVRGHFALQAYGPGWSKRRLRWISEYEKPGYTRLAKKLMVPIKEERQLLTDLNNKIDETERELDTH